MIKKGLFGIGVGPFPSIPFNASLDIDLSRTKTIAMSFGDGTFNEYIPIGYLAGLYELLKGRPSAAMGGQLLTKNAVVHRIVLAKSYSVKFESTEKFSLGVDAKLKAYNDLPEVGGKVKVAKTTERTIEAKVDSPTYYLIGITAIKWSDLKWCVVDP